MHIDGYNLAAIPDGRGGQVGPRQGLIYFSDDGDVLALRFDNWKVVFMEQRVQGTLQIWAQPFIVLRVPEALQPAHRPYERADITSNTYWEWFMQNDYLALAATAWSTQFLTTFREFPPPQRGRELHDRPGPGGSSRLRSPPATRHALWRPPGCGGRQAP